MSLQVLIAEDSTLFVDVLCDTLRDEPDIEIADVVDNGVDAIEACQTLRPDIVLMDIQMPRMDGLSATEEIMANTPTPILVITSDPHMGGVDQSFRALSAGALDLMPKPDRVPFSDADRDQLLKKIRLLAKIPVVRHVRARRRQRMQTPVHRPDDETAKSDGSGDSGAIIGIVGSTGGPRALAKICTALPEDFPASLVIVQHITDGFSHHLAGWLDKHSRLSVSEARPGEPLRTGCAYIAPTRRHLVVDDQLKLDIIDEPPVGGHRPSGNLLLKSLARHAAGRTVGLVLSGMGDDGADGLAALADAGSPTLTQNEETSVVYGMPRVAIERGVVDEILADTELPDRLIELAANINAESGGDGR